jgi:hypothetical protein
MACLFWFRIKIQNPKTMKKPYRKIITDFIFFVICSVATIISNAQDSPAIALSSRAPLNGIHVSDSPLFVLNENLISDELKITFNLPQTSTINVHILDLIGREVKAFTTGTLEAGKHTQIYSVADLPKGLYLVTVESLQTADTRKIVIE